MKKMLLSTLAVALLACEPGDDTARNGAADGAVENVTETSLQAGQDGFALLLNGDTLAVERYSRSGNTLDGELVDMQSGDRLTYRATLADERITRLELAYHPAGATEAAQTGVAEFRGDTLVTHSREREGEAQIERIVPPPGTMLVIANSIAFLEQVSRRFIAQGGADARVPVLLVGGDDADRGGVQQANVRRIGADSVLMALDSDSEARAAIDDAGNIRGAASQGGNVQIVRLR